MKPLDHFLQQMMASTSAVRLRDPAGATDIIQRALRDAGLLDAAPPAAEPAKTQPGCIDINPPPLPPSGPRARSFLRRARAKENDQSRPQAPQREPDTSTAGSFSCPAGQRRYRLYVPERPSTTPRPLIVMLHGCTQNAADFATGTGMNALADKHDCVVLYPEQDRAANANGCWNWFAPEQQVRDGGEPAILAALTRHIVAEHNIDPGKVFVAGLSAGGAMAAILGAAYPDLYAAVGVHSGLAAGSGKDMISGLQAMKRPARATALDRSVPIIVFHGDADHVVHPGNGDAVLKQFLAPHDANGVTEQTRQGEESGHAYTRTSWHTVSGQLIAEQWLVHGAAHAWQGGQAAGSHTNPNGPDASRAMLRFFLQQSSDMAIPA